MRRSSMPYLSSNGKGPGCFMAKTDVKSAFRIIPIHPNDFALLGMKWQNAYYFDRCLPMGCCSSCAIFEAFSTALEWLAMNRLGASGVLLILDDFLFIADSHDKCHADLTNFLSICEYIGVPIAQEKTVGPATTLQFMGITLDSVLQEARLPVDKLQKCRMLLRTFYKRRKVLLGNCSRSSMPYLSSNGKGPGCFMAKTDVKSAFRIIPIHPNDFALLGMKWQNAYYFDRCLPMGCCSSCAIFEAFSTALEWLAMNRLGASGVLLILDDFLFIADSHDKCHADLTNFLSICEYIGVPIAQEKTVGPATTLQFMGITLDSVLQEARLPVDKLQKCRMLLRTFYKRRKVLLGNCSLY